MAQIRIYSYGRVIADIEDTEDALVEWIRNNVLPTDKSQVSAKKELIRGDLPVNEVKKIAKDRHYSFRRI